MPCDLPWGRFIPELPEAYAPGRKQTCCAPGKQLAHQTSAAETIGATVKNRNSRRCLRRHHQHQHSQIQCCCTFEVNNRKTRMEAYAPIRVVTGGGSSRMEAYAPIRAVTDMPIMTTPLVRVLIDFDHCVLNGLEQLLTFEARPIPPRVEDLLESHVKVQV